MKNKYKIEEISGNKKESNWSIELEWPEIDFNWDLTGIEWPEIDCNWGTDENLLDTNNRSKGNVKK